MSTATHHPPRTEPPAGGPPPPTPGSAPEPGPPTDPDAGARPIGWALALIGAGTMTIDLRDLELPPGTTEPSASVSMGEPVVPVPEDVTVTGTGQTVAGEVETFGATAAGINPRRAIDEDGPEDGPILELELRTGLGRIEVTR